MDTVPTGRVIPFPSITTWSRVAHQYVEYVLRGNPQAVCYYLEHQLSILKLTKFPAALRAAIDREHKKRGIGVEPCFH